MQPANPPPPRPPPKTVRFGLSNSYPYDKNFSILTPYKTSVESSWLIKMPTSNKHQRETIFDVNSVHFFIHFIAISPLYIYAEFCNVHSGSNRFVEVS